MSEEIANFLVQTEPTLKFETVGGKFIFGHSEAFRSWAPVFEINPAYERPKLLTRSILETEFGDTVDHGIRSLDGTLEQPKEWKDGYFIGGFLYWQTGHVDCGQVSFAPATKPIIDGQEMPVGTTPCYGRSAEIYPRAVGDQSGTNRGATLVFATTKENEVVTRERAWLSDEGTLVLGSRSSYEDGHNTYPAIQRFSDWAGGMDRGAGIWSTIQGKHDSGNTPGVGNLFIVASDMAKPESSHWPAWTVRKYGDIGTGIDFGIRGDDFVVWRHLDSGEKIPVIEIGITSGDVRFLPGQGGNVRVWAGNHDPLPAGYTTRPSGIVRIKDQGGNERMLLAVELVPE